MTAPASMAPAPGLVTRTVALVEALREFGMAVSVAETVDAVTSLGLVDLADREGLRAALAATTVKDYSHRPTFDALFDLWFPAVVTTPIEGATDAVPSPAEEGADQVPAGEAGTGGQGGGGGGQGRLGGRGGQVGTGAPAAGTDRAAAAAAPAEQPAALTPAELGALRGAMRHRLAELLAQDDRRGQQRLARDAVTQVGQVQGASGSTTYSAMKTLSELSPDSMLASLVTALRGDQPPTGMADAVARRTAQGRISAFERYVRDEAMRRLAETKGEEYVARLSVSPLLEHVEFLGAREEALAAMGRAVQPIARRLATKLTAKRRYGDSGRLDFRRTARASLATGGVALDPVFRPKRPRKPELVVLCDVSKSVAAFATFTLQLTYALSQEFARVRCFAFIDTTDEITGYLEGADDLPTALRRVALEADVVRLDGRSDYGHALGSFRELFGEAVTSRTSLLVLGDARSNGRDERADILLDLAGRARHAYWLNPEPRAAWGTRDSVTPSYSEAIEMIECRSVEQLTAFVERILPQ